MTRRTVAISVGCPAGIGPEVALVAAARSREVRSVLVGDVEVVRRAAAVRRFPEGRLVGIDGKHAAHALRPGQVGVWLGSSQLDMLPDFGRPTPAAGEAQLAWIDEATDLVRAGIADALVTGPVSKAAIASSGAPRAAEFRGHTEHLARQLRAREVVMAFTGGAITTALVTTHLGLAQVPRAITPAAVARATFWLASLVIALRGRRRGAPRVLVAALNPHAGEQGLLGKEEQTRILPGIAAARERLGASGIDVVVDGPTGAETAYRLCARGDVDGVVAMYHDQATIPCKLLDFGDSVNVTLGLPLVRTSVDHGTAYDMAGGGKADAAGMAAAIALAARLAAAGRKEPTKRATKPKAKTTPAGKGRRARS